MKLFVVQMLLGCCFFMDSINYVTGSIKIINDQNITVEIIDSVSAAFGPPITDDGFEGYIVLSNPIGGCTKIEKPPTNISYVDPDQWIVLIKRTPSASGNCSFDLKVRNAQLAGYKAVIIYNSESDTLLKMSSSGQYDIRIPSVFISRSDGHAISAFYTYVNRTFAIINNDDDNLNYLLIPFISVVSVCFIIAVSIFLSKFIYHVYKLRKNRFPKSALKKIPTKKYQKTDKYDTCPICLNEYEEGEKMRILPCEHAYHVECIDKWLLRNNRFCPVCKRRVLPGGSDSESEDGNESGRTTVQSTLANEDDNPNESTRLLVNVRDNNVNSNEDNLSSATTNTTVNTVNITNETTQNNPPNNTNDNNQMNNDLSSMNNQMTVSLTSSQAQTSLQNQNKDLRSSSSRYGSMSSSLNIITVNPATTSKSTELGNGSDDDKETNYQNSEKPEVEAIDSKATPEFHSPIEPVSLPISPAQTTEDLSAASVVDLPPVKSIKKKNSKKNKNKIASSSSSSYTQDITPGTNVQSIMANSDNNEQTFSDKERLISKTKTKRSKKKSNNPQTSKNTDNDNSDPIV